MILVRVLSFKVYITYKKVKSKVYIYICILCCFCIPFLPPSLFSFLCYWFLFLLFQAVHFDRHDIGHDPQVHAGSTGEI